MEQFIEHYENKHIPLVRDLAGTKFPLRHTRHYVHRTQDTTSSGAQTPATIIKGRQEDISYDCVVEIVFDDKAAFDAFLGILADQEVATKLAEDEAAFVDPIKSSIVQASHSSTSTRE